MEPRAVKTTNGKRLSIKLFMIAGLISLLLAPSAWAVGTQSGTDITNRATIDYAVGGINQEDIESSPTGNSTPGLNQGADTTLEVDNVVRLVVASAGNTNVIPTQADRTLVFTVTNTGNTTQGYAVEVLTGATNIPMSNVRVYRDVNGDGFLDGGDTLYTSGSGANIGDLNPNGVIGTDDVMQIIIVADTPDATQAVNGETDTYSLRVTTLDAGTTTVTAQTRVGLDDDLAAVDVVFDDADGDAGANDGLRDGRHIDSGDFVVGSAQLSVSKTASVVEDPVLGPSPNAKAIPGARVRYTITVDNTAGSNTAEAVTITDPIQADTTYVPNSVVIGGTPTPDGDPAVTYTAGPPAQIAVVAGDVAAGASVAVTFDVTIN